MPLSDNMRGAILMMLSMAAFTLNDTLVKTLSQELPLFQVILLRGVVTSVMIAALGLLRREIRFDISLADWKIIGWRTFAEIGATGFYLTALFHMPIANIMAILQALPLAITLAGAVFLGETVGWRRYGAILIGFMGVMLIVRPGGTAFDIYSVYAVISVAFVVLRDLSTRRLSRQVSSLTVALITAVSITLLGGVVTVFTDWQPVSFHAVRNICGASAFIVAGYLFAVMVMRVGEIAFVAPFRYTGLLWAIVLGILVFGDYPDTMTLLGSVIVVGMGLYTFYRERNLERAARKPRTT